MTNAAPSAMITTTAVGVLIRFHTFTAHLPWIGWNVKESPQLAANGRCTSGTPARASPDTSAVTSSDESARHHRAFL